MTNIGTLPGIGCFTLDQQLVLNIKIYNRNPSILVNEVNELLRGNNKAIVTTEYTPFIDSIKCSATLNLIIVVFTFHSKSVNAICMGLRQRAQCVYKNIIILLLQLQCEPCRALGIRFYSYRTLTFVQSEVT